jgi:hypothetical protein
VRGKESSAALGLCPEPCHCRGGRSERLHRRGGCPGPPASCTVYSAVEPSPQLRRAYAKCRRETSFSLVNSQTNATGRGTCLISGRFWRGTPCDSPSDALSHVSHGRVSHDKRQEAPVLEGGSITVARAIFRHPLFDGEPVLDSDLSGALGPSWAWARRTGGLYGLMLVTGCKAAAHVSDSRPRRWPTGKYPSHPGIRTTRDKAPRSPSYRGTGALRAAYFVASDLGDPPPGSPHGRGVPGRLPGPGPSLGVFDTKTLASAL